MGPANSCKKAFIRSLETPNIPMPADKFLHLIEGFYLQLRRFGGCRKRIGRSSHLGCGQFYQRHVCQLTFEGYAGR